MKEIQKRWHLIIQKWRPFVLNWLLPTSIFLWIALSIFPFLPSGYFFLLDDPIFYSRMAGGMGNLFDFSFFPLSLVFNGLTVFLDFWIIQRGVYIFALFLLGFWGYRLLSETSKIGGLFAGMLAIFNPFVFARVATWQINVLFGIIMGVWSIFFLRQFFISGKLYFSIIASLFYAVSIMWTPHAVFLVGVPSGLIFLFFCIKMRRGWLPLKGMVSYFILAFILNAGWIFGSIYSSGYTSKTIETINKNHYLAFATSSGTSGVYKNVAMLQGFWREGTDPTIKNYQSNRRWKYPTYILASFILLGIITRLYSFRKNPWGFDVAILLSSIVAYILAIGISGNTIISGISYFLYDHLPFYSGMREPQKWVWILLIGYAYFGGLGVAWVVNLPNIQKYFRFLLASVIIAFPIAAMPNMFYFLGSTLHSTDFPKSWYQASAVFEKTPVNPKVSSFLKDCAYVQNLRSRKCYDVLTLPWHLYVSFNFTSSSIVNPMMPFFSKYRVLQGDNIEAGEQLYSQSTKPESKIIENYIGPNGLFPNTRSASREVYAAFIQDVKGLGIQFIILPDPHRWAYEDELLKTGVLFNFLKPIFQEPDMKVYLLQ